MEKKLLLVGCEEDNHAVIDFYMNIVESVFLRKGYEIRLASIKDSGTFEKKTPVFVVTCGDAAKWRLKGFKNIIYWSQGILPEESRLRHNSQIRYLILSIIEWFALKTARVCLLVSHYQCEYYERKYKIAIKDKVFFMPCYNCEIEESSFKYDGKYNNNIFCYVGSLAKWQCFDKTVDYFKKIQQRVPTAVLKVLTPSVEDAKLILEEKGINNTIVKYVNQDHLADELKECKYGFIIRDNISINNVATPTKLSTYLANGMIPIVSNCIQEFKLMLSGLHYKVLVSEKLESDEVVRLSTESVNRDSVFNEYKAFFDKYYNTQTYINQLTTHIEHILSI